MKFLTPKKTILYIAFIHLSVVSIYSQKFYYSDSAFLAAEQLNRPVLLNFSGSDWCPGCIRFHKNVINNSAFEEFMESNLILLIAEFPQKQKQSNELVKQNEGLAEKYNPQGSFPKLILLSPHLDSQIELTYKNQNAGEFLVLVKENIKKLNP